ncbi:MAG: trypsin-like peptidase domain-containing protein [Hyphomicrobiaceae bacterium]
MTDSRIASIDDTENSAITYLALHYPAFPGPDNYVSGSGLYIGGAYILTAAHNFFQVEYNGQLLLSAGSEVDRVRVSFGRDGLSHADAIVELTDAPASIEYIRGYNASDSDPLNDDLALLRLDTASVPLAGPIHGLAAFADDTVLGTLGVRIAGFPAADTVPGADGYTLFETESSVTGVTDFTFKYHFAETEAGMSGGPVFVSVDGVEYVGGVHKSGPEGVLDEVLFPEIGTRLTLTDIAAIMALLEPAEGGTDAIDLPANLLVGSDSFLTLFGNDAITSSYRRDIVRGLGGEDEIEGRGSHDQIDGGAGDDVLIGDGFDVGDPTDSQGLVNFDVFGNDFLDGGAGNDTVRTGWDHRTGVRIEIGNALAHQDVFDAAGYSGVSLTSDVVIVAGAGGTDFVRNVETINRSSALIAGAEVPPPLPDTAADTLALTAFDAASLGQLQTIDLAGGRDVIDLGALGSGISVTLDSEARYTLTRMDGGEGELVVWNANDIIGTNYDDKLKGGHLEANEYIDLASGAVAAGEGGTGFAAVFDSIHRLTYPHARRACVGYLEQSVLG